MNRRRKRLLGLLLVSGGIGIVAKFFVSPFLVVGESMTPTLANQELCLVSKFPQYEPRRGDIVVFRTSNRPPLRFVKRVVALPGETLAIQHGVVKINGTPVPEPYTTVNADWELPPTVVPAEKVYVIGDNRTVSMDDTLHGLVATHLVEARLLAHWRWRR